MTETMLETVIETRSGEGYEIAEVNFPKRIVTVVAIPYERPTQIVEARGAYIEVVSKGAFSGIEKRAKQIRANRDHTWDKLVGKVVAVHPSRAEGLVTEVKMFGTDIGERTLVECDEGGLDASAGFGLLRRDDGRVWDDAEVWDRTHTTRRLNRLFLDHVAFVPNPAYPDAVVQDVRNAPLGPGGVEATPNRDRLALQELAAAKEALDRRFLR